MALPRFLRRKMQRALEREGALIYEDRMRADRFRALVDAPDTVIDVGVAGGTPWLYRAFPKAQFLLVDPMPECEARVAAAFPDLVFDFHPVALGAEAGSVELKIPLVGENAHASKASTLTRTDHFTPLVSDWETREVPVQRLDALAPTDGRLGLKIDTEGAEATILRGATSMLARCDFVVLELSLRKRFTEVDPPSVCIDLLGKAGLELRDVLSLNGGGTAQSPNHMDCLFTRWS